MSLCFIHNVFNNLHEYFTFVWIPGDPLYVDMDITIASFDAISEVNMVRRIIYLETSRLAILLQNAISRAGYFRLWLSIYYTT